jgi:hypothetical protein
VGHIAGLGVLAKDRSAASARNQTVNGPARSPVTVLTELSRLRKYSYKTDEYPKENLV